MPTECASDVCTVCVHWDDGLASTLGFAYSRVAPIGYTADDWGSGIDHVQVSRSRPSRPLPETARMSLLLVDDEVPANSGTLDTVVSVLSVASSVLLAVVILGAGGHRHLKL